MIALSEVNGDLAAAYEAFQAEKAKALQEHYGTSEGVMKAWDTRGRGRKEEEKKPDTRVSKENEESSSKAQRVWNEFEYGEGNIPTEENPKIIEEYMYFEGSDEQLNGEFENPDDSDATFDAEITTQAKVYFYNDILFIENNNQNVRAMNRIKTEDVKAVVDNLPSKLSSVIDTITINPFECKEDERAIAAAEGTSLFIYGNKSSDEMEDTLAELPYIFAHEAAHAYDGIGTQRISLGEEWKEAMSDNKTLTSYSGITGKREEDFAEAVAIFSTKPGELEKLSPKRYNFLMKMFKG